MRKFSFFILYLSLGGCVTILESPTQTITNLSSVSQGMTQQEVAAVMGKTVVIGYEQSQGQRGAYVPVTLNNPQRLQKLSGSGRAFEIIYYFTHIQLPDGKITNDELTPLVFENNRLTGKGWRYLEGLVGKYKLN